MSYDAYPDPYLDPKTGVLKNLIGVRSQDRLEEVEAIITFGQVIYFYDNPLEGDFNLKYLQAIHKELFSPIYSWAGQLRTVEVAKGNTRFANSNILEQAAASAFSGTADLLAKQFTKDEYAKKLAHCYSEVNILHPFREGNGRTQRLFFSQLVGKSGYRLAWEQMDAKANISACEAAYKGDEGPLAKMLSDLLEK
jgi:cell filamentation protein